MRRVNPGEPITHVGSYTSCTGGAGYWITADDGGVFAFDAPFFGSTGDLALNAPVNGMNVDPSGLGYWLVADDGGVFTYGAASFYGSTGDLTLVAPILGMAVSAQ